MDWLEEEWNAPSRGDHYLMQVAAEVRRVLHRSPAQVKPEGFRLTFQRRKKDKNRRALTREDLAAMHKARWLWAVGFRPKKKADSGDGENK
jgi:hypothetical protein